MNEPFREAAITAVDQLVVEQSEHRRTRDMLCGLCSELPDGFQHNVDGLDEWWEQHQKDDAVRKAREYVTTCRKIRDYLGAPLSAGVDFPDDLTLEHIHLIEKAMVGLVHDSKSNPYPSGDAYQAYHQHLEYNLYYPISANARQRVEAIVKTLNL